MPVFMAPPAQAFEIGKRKPFPALRERYFVMHFQATKATTAFTSVTTTPHNSQAALFPTWRVVNMSIKSNPFLDHWPQISCTLGVLLLVLKPSSLPSLKKLTAYSTEVVKQLTPPL